MIKYVFLNSLIISGLAMSSSMADKYTIPSLFGTAEIKWCGSDQAQDSTWCITENAGEKCGNYTGRGIRDEQNKPKDAKNILEKGLWIAQTVSDHGAWVCPMTLKVRGDDCWIYRQFTASRLLNFPCHWVCENGWGGDKCDVKLSEWPFCNNRKINANVHLNGSYTPGSPQLGTTINTWNNAKDGFRYCDGKGGQSSHLGVIIATPMADGHGMFLQPYTIRFQYTSKDYCSNMWHTGFSINLTASGSTVATLCKPGYQLENTNSDNVWSTKCVPVDEEMCKIGATSFCANFPADKFDKNIHTIKTNDNSSGNQGCAMYVCSNDMYGFATAEDRTCSVCADSPLLGGAHPKTGICVKCEVGQYYDKESGTCKKANSYNKMDLLYSKGKSRKDVSNDVKQQCWSVLSAENYKQCIETGKVPDSVE